MKIKLKTSIGEYDFTYTVENEKHTVIVENLENNEVIYNQTRALLSALLKDALDLIEHIETYDIYQIENFEYSHSTTIAFNLIINFLYNKVELY